MTKKTALGAAAILIPFALLLLAVWLNIGTIKDALAQAILPASTAKVVLEALGQLRWISVVLFGCAALIATGFVLFLGYLNDRPMEAMSKALSEGDISDDLSKGNNEVCREYNGFIKKLRQILGHTRKIGLEVAVGSTELARAVRDLRVKGKKHGDLAEAIYFANVEMSHKIVDVSSNNHSLHQSTGTNLSIAKSSLEELRKVGFTIDRTGNSALQFTQTAERLTTTSKHIKDMANLVDEISSQLHNLALKAATEAGRAGESGRGFSAVASELKQMAERTSAVGGGEILVNMMGMVRDVQEMGRGIHDNMGGMSKAVNNTISHFDNLVHAFEDNKDQLSKIEVAVEDLANKNRVVHAQVTDARELSKEVEAILSGAALSATSMNRKTEALLEAVSQFKIGNDGLERRIAAVTSYRDQIQSKIAGMFARGIDIFDQKYRPIPNTNPQKYHTAFDMYFERELQGLYDSAVKDMDAIYCVAVDINGYIATQNARVSKPLTGDYETDLLYSRDKRIFNNIETEIRRFKNTNPFLLQTYMRDTGEILNDFALPIYIDGKHWGCMVVGFQPQKLLQNAALARA